MSRIYYTRQETYEAEGMMRSVSCFLKEMGVPEELARLSEEKGREPKIVLKVNLITGRKPADCATTHPAVVRAVCLALRSFGARDITIADSPGGPFTPEALNHIYRVCGLTEIEEEGLAKLNRDVAWDTVFTPEVFTARNFTRIRVVKEADYLINLPKLKTHAMMKFTCGIKNLFGTIPGLQKPEMHYRFPNTEAFAHMLVELCDSVHPAVTLIDAVDGMEGNGPTGGTVRHLGLLFASRDVFTQDLAAAAAAGLDPMSVPILSDAVKSGRAKPEEMELWELDQKEESFFPASFLSPAFPAAAGKTEEGRELAPLEMPFVLPDAQEVTFVGYLPGFLRKPALTLASRLFHPVPKVDHAKCVGCGKCAESCPQHLIEIRDKKAHFTSKGCISCFCCQEMCPAKAIEVKRIFR